MEKAYRRQIEAQIMDQESWDNHRNFVNVTKKKILKSKYVNESGISLKEQ